MDFKEILSKVGLRKSSWDERVLAALKPITDHTLDLSPTHADTSIWVSKILDRINENAHQLIAHAVGNNPETAAATADKLLSNCYDLQYRFEKEDFDRLKMVILGNANQFIADLNIPSDSKKIPVWQQNIVAEFKNKYARGNYSEAKKWSTGSHLVVAVKLLEIANPEK